MKKIVKLIVVLAVTAQVLAGCGSAGNAEETSETAKTPAAETETVEEKTDTAAEEGGEAVDTSETEDAGNGAREELTPDPTNLSYLEEIQIEDYYGDGAKYPLYMPKGGENEDGFFFYSEHGATFTANVFNVGDPQLAAGALQAYMEQTVSLLAKDWEDDPDCSDVGVGEMLEKGDDRYLFITATAKDFNDIPYQKTKLIYMSVREGGVGVFWDMEVRENAQDEETLPLINEVGRCYGIHLGELEMKDGEWASQDAQRAADAQDVYEPEEGEPVVQKVEGYQYLGMIEMGFLMDEENFTCPVLVPMGRSTTIYEDSGSVSASMHGVGLRFTFDYSSGSNNYQRMTQDSAEWDFKYASDPEQENRNVRLIDMMPMKGQEAGVYYVIEYEEKEWNGEEYHKRADVNFCIQVKEQYFIFGDIYLKSADYDSKTNDLIKELETAYGLDLSEWYAQEDIQ